MTITTTEVPVTHKVNMEKGDVVYSFAVGITDEHKQNKARAKVGGTLRAIRRRLRELRLDVKVWWQKGTLNVSLHSPHLKKLLHLISDIKGQLVSVLVSLGFAAPTPSVASPALTYVNGGHRSQSRRRRLAS